MVPSLNNKAYLQNAARICRITPIHLGYFERHQTKNQKEDPSSSCQAITTGLVLLNN